jgi:glycosyltransferase involved in cell wall biosynthesis
MSQVDKTSLATETIARRARMLAFLPDLTRGGAQRSVVNLLNVLDREVVAASLAVPSTEGDAASWLAEHVELIDLHRRRTRSALGPLRRLVRDRSPDLLFASMVDANIAAALATLGLAQAPKLVLRETNSHRARGDLGALRRALMGWAYRKADRVVALSHGVRDELIEDYRLDPARVVTIHNPVDVTGISERARRIRSGPPPWGDWAEGQPVILAAGRLVRQKGFDVLLSAVAEIEGAPRLVLLGHGPDYETLDQLAGTLGLSERVLMPGSVEHPSDWMAHADLFVLSSRWEGFGHVIVEAMAAECPVVATDCPHGPRDIITDGVDGLLVAPESASALEVAASNLLAEPQRRSRIARAGRQTAMRFDCSRIGQSYQHVIMEVLDAVPDET